MLVEDTLPSSSVTSKVTVLRPGEFHPTVGFWFTEVVPEKSEVSDIPWLEKFTPVSNSHRYSTIIPSSSVNISGNVRGVRVYVCSS